MVPGRRLAIAATLAFLATGSSLHVPFANAQDAGPSTRTPSDEDFPLSQHVSQLYRAGKYGEATPLAQELVNLTKNSGDAVYAAAISWLALLYHTQGRYAEAEPLYEQALAIQRTATALNNLAALYGEQGRHADAEPLVKRALAIDENALGPEHPDVASDLANLARLYEEQGRYADAEPLYNRAIAIDEKALGLEHASVGSKLNNLAWLYRAQGRYEEAEPLVNRAIAIDEKALGPEHPEVGRALDTLAKIYEGQGRVNDAEPLYRRALANLEKSLGSDHPSLAVPRGNLGGLYKAQGRLAEAEPLIKSALAIKQQVFGPDHPHLASSLTQLADLYRLQGRCTEAEPLFLRARAIGAEAIEEVPILFGTDRKRDSSQPSVAFGGEREKEVAFGLAFVTVPKEQTSAQIVAPVGTSPSNITEARRLAMQCIQLITAPDLVAAAVRRLAESRRYPNQAVMFVHGYNVSFENAVRRAAQVAYDLKFDGATFLFSWPSRGQFMDYFSDRETVDIAAEHLKEFLEKIVTETKATKIHFIAHSMGNMVLLRALASSMSESSTLGPAIGEVIDAAPDVDPDLFVQMVKKIQAKGANFTLYASRSDKALWLSGWMRDRPRAGFITDKPLIIAGVDTIDITDTGSSGWFDLFALNHDIYSSNPTIVGDMQRIVEHRQRPPDKRTKEFEPMVSQEGTYWRLPSSRQDTKSPQQK